MEPTIHATPGRRLTTLALGGMIAMMASISLPAVAAEQTSVVPDIVPKAEMQAVPEGEVNVSYAPNVPPPSGRTEPAIVDVAFEVVENVTAIDPATGVEYETWGYVVAGDEGVATGTPNRRPPSYPWLSATTSAAAATDPSSPISLSTLAARSGSASSGWASPTSLIDQYSARVCQ